MDNVDVKALLRRYVAGQCTEAEKTLVERAYIALSDGDTLIDEAAVDRNGNEIWKMLPVHRQTQRRSRKLTHWLRYAAAFMLFASMVGYVVWDSQQGTTVDKENQILPGGNRAMLTLADGSSIPLKADQNTVVVGGGAVSYADGSRIVASPMGADKASETGEQVLTTPRGGQYRIILPDGSKVWLNAASTLRYPSRFEGAQRRVILKGEAYFDIVADKQAPFLVQTHGPTIEVLGTRFNIATYEDENETITTLVDGRVRLDNSLELSPGQQATARGTQLDVLQVDTEPYTSWKDGLFMFDREPLEHILRRMSRWYDVGVRFEQDDLRAELFSGTVSRFENAEQVLEILALTAKADFRIAGRTIIVSAPKADATINTEN